MPTAFVISERVPSFRFEFLDARVGDALCLRSAGSSIVQACLRQPAMADPDFALPRSSYGELLKMVHAYFLADNRSRGEPVTLSDVAGQAGMDRTIISRNNGFFTSLGLIEGGQRKVLTPRGRDLGLAVSHDDDSLISSAFVPLVLESDFLSRILNAVRVRSGMDAPSLQTHIAISAGAPKTPPFLTGAAAVVQILQVAGLLVDDEGLLKARNLDDLAGDERPQASSDQTREIEAGAAAIAPRRLTSSREIGATRQREVVVNINLNLDVGEESAETAIELLRRLLGAAMEASSSDSAKE